eukprot:CAMPEP_0168540466 /NCGR_PEP_ID=MMETSP0413-20121227/292_1 /TAXON_ID=136452 /ORGANISM="Filamoeba nolandi, Strain NC-AS-23-1" /LENGTH=539 /DNA_ID=CAMNT_0008570203 /DNA_START=72 /DNA_END=1692 /DNA_ORIENTATION=+
MSDVNHLVQPSSSKNSTAEGLTKHLQETCFQKICIISRDLQSHVNDIEKKLESLQREQNRSGTPNIVVNNINVPRINPSAERLLDEVLFVGRVSNAIHKQSTVLQSVFYPNQPQQTSAAFQSPSKARQVPSHKGNPIFASVVQQLKRVYLTSHKLWISWIAKEFIAYLDHNVNSDNWSDPNRKSSWQELLVTVEGEDNTTSEEKLQLPFEASSFVIAFLFAVTDEIQRVGSHTLDKAVIQCLVFELCDKVFELYHGFLEKHLPMNKEGCIQLIFDLKFVFDILAGRRDVEAAQNVREMTALMEATSPRYSITDSSQQIDEFAEIMEWTNKVNKLILQVQNQLDPIDIAFYDSHLKQAIQRAYRRTSAFFGLLTQLNRLYLDKHKAPLQEQHNVLVLSPLVPRFTLLPITTPPLKSLNSFSRGAGAPNKGTANGTQDNKDKTKTDPLQNNGFCRQIHFVLSGYKTLMKVVPREAITPTYRGKRRRGYQLGVKPRLAAYKSPISASVCPANNSAIPSKGDCVMEAHDIRDGTTPKPYCIQL